MSVYSCVLHAELPIESAMTAVESSITTALVNNRGLREDIRVHLVRIRMERVIFIRHVVLQQARDPHLPWTSCVPDVETATLISSARRAASDTVSAVLQIAGTAEDSFVWNVVLTTLAQHREGRAPGNSLCRISLTMTLCTATLMITTIPQR